MVVCHDTKFRIVMSRRSSIFLFTLAPYLDYHGPGLPGKSYVRMYIAGAFGCREVQGVSLHGYLQDRNRRGALRCPRCASLQFAVNRAVCMATPSRHDPRGRFLFRARAGGRPDAPEHARIPSPIRRAECWAYPAFPLGKGQIPGLANRQTLII